MTFNKINADSPDYFLSKRSLKVRMDGIRGLMPLEGPDVVTFLAGRPNPVTFPFNSITLEMKPPLGDSHFPAPDGNKASDGIVNLKIEGEALESALQYGPSAGLAPLLKTLTELQETVHGRDRASEGWAISVGSGCQDLMTKAFQACMNFGDSVLLETPMYAGVMPILAELEADMIEVEVDDQGLNAKSLEKIMSEWPANKPRPKIIYSTPVGSNPTGCSAYEERKLEVLELCKKYDLMIFEDDPYYYLATESIPSYFKLEKRVFPNGGRVLRFDSFSKLLSAGMRLGFVTGPARILECIDVNTATANLHTSGVSQAIAARLLQYWGIKGFREHATRVADFYAGRREIFEKLAHKYLDGLATWVSPKHSMFCWVEINDIDDTYDLVLKEALAKGVLAVPGQNFYPSGRKSAHIRVSFSVIDLEDGPNNAELGLQRLAEAIRERRATMGLPSV